MKQLILFLIFRLQLYAIWRHWNRKKITILMLHGIAGDSHDTNWSPLWERPPVDRMVSVLEQLKSHYTLLTLEEAVRILEGSAPPVDHGLVLTFDDGYRNNFSVALPRLNEISVPATFFVATGFVETQQAYWVDRLDYALQQAPDEQRLLEGHGHRFDLRGLDREALASSYRNLRQTLKKREREDKGLLRVVDAFSESLEGLTGTSVTEIIDTDPNISVATWAEQKAAVDAGATIGSHSVDHFRLTAIPKSDVDGQLVESKKAIEEELGVECDFFCYPNGSVDDFVRERTREAGYRAAVTTVRGLNSIGDDLHSLKRHGMPMSEDERKNLLQISGILESRLAKAILGTG